MSAARSTLLYEPLATMKSNVAAASGRVKLRERPNSSPTPATPVNSVTSDPIDGRRQAQSRKPGPAKAKPHADQFAMAAAGVETEPHGQFLNHVQHGDQQQNQRQQAIAPLRAALGRGDDIAGVGVGQHDEEARAPRSQSSGENEAARTAFDCVSAFIAPALR